MLALFTLQNIKTYLILLAGLCIVWLYKDYQFQKDENKRQTSNMANLRKQDSIRYAAQVYTKKELKEYLAYNRKDLQEFLSENKIATRKIQQIITQSLTYKDTTTRRIDLQPILAAIQNKQNIKIPIVDSTDCLVISGFIAFEDDTLSLNITNREFKNKTDVISYWERNQWKFLGLKTRLFGRKKATVIIKDNCGQTKTFLINKRK